MNEALILELNEIIEVVIHSYNLEDPNEVAILIHNQQDLILEALNKHK